LLPTVRLSVLVSLVALAGGCATTSATPETCDPTKGGFFGGLACQGHYQTRIDRRHEELESEMGRRARLAREKESLDQERTALARQVEDQEAYRDRLEGELADLERKIDTGKKGDAALEQQARELREQRTTVDADLDAKADRIAELQREIDALEAEGDAAY